MNRRTKVLAAAVLAVAGLFLADKILISPYLEGWRKVAAEEEKVDQEILKARTILERRQAVQQGWDKVRRLLEKPRVPDVQNHFMAHLGEISGRIGANHDVKGIRDQQQGDFKEYVYETAFKLKWEQLTGLLVELHNSREFLKPLRLAVSSQYEKEDRLDVDLKVSTIEYAPGRTK